MNVNRVGQLRGVYQPGPLRAQARKGSVAGKSDVDEINISSEGRYFDVAKKAASQLSDVRQDRVDAIMKRIESGKYDVASSLVAKKLLDESY